MRTKPFKKVAAFYILCLSSFLHWCIVHYFVQRELLKIGKSKKLLILENCFLPQQFLCVIADTVANSNCTIFSCKMFFVYYLFIALYLVLKSHSCVFFHISSGVHWKHERGNLGCALVRESAEIVWLYYYHVWLLECTCYFGKIKCSVDHNFSAQW